MIERDLIKAGKLTDSHIAEMVRRHKGRDVSFYSPSFKRHARIRWRLYNCETGFWRRGND